jgi:hypothetical protein
LFFLVYGIATTGCPDCPPDAERRLGSYQTAAVVIYVGAGLVLALQRLPQTKDGRSLLAVVSVPVLLYAGIPALFLAIVLDANAVL